MSELDAYGALAGTDKSSSVAWCWDYLRHYEELFRPFRTSKREGSGIGLAMTYRILQLHNGQVDVQSQPGKGTTFVLRLPLSNSTDLRLRNSLPAGTALSKEPRG